MTALQQTLTILDWLALGLLASMLLFMALGAYRLRQEIQEASRIEAATRQQTASQPHPDRH
jgi:hypothetical protein